MSDNTGMWPAVDQQEHKDMKTCELIPAKRINVRLPEPLQMLVSATPDITTLPYFDSKSDANIAMIKQVKRKIVMHQRITESNQLVEIAKPIAVQMQMLKPTLVNKLDSYVPMKLSLMLTVTVFIGNLGLHILVMYIYHRFAIVRKYTPQFVKNFLPNPPSDEHDGPSAPPAEGMVATVAETAATSGKRGAHVLLPGTIAAIDAVDAAIAQDPHFLNTIQRHVGLTPRSPTSIASSRRNSCHREDEIDESTT